MVVVVVVVLITPPPRSSPLFPTLHRVWFISSPACCRLNTKKVAVVAAIVKSGLRIMPHSGGRVGKGIYLASENAKRWGRGRKRGVFYVI